MRENINTFFSDKLITVAKLKSLISKIVDIIECMYEKTERVFLTNNLTEWFKVIIGVRQGCLLSPTSSTFFLNLLWLN